MPLCKFCYIELTDENWTPCCKKKGSRLCARCASDRSNNSYRRHKDSRLRHYKEVRQQIRHSVFEYYGGHCELCGETDFAKLSLDHVDGNGRQHRKEVLGT